jgi:hypothetical protein
MECDNPSQQSTLNRISADKFLLVLNLPYILKEKSKTDRRINIDPLQMKVKGIVVPTINVPHVGLPYKGQTYNVSSHARPEYPPIELQFPIDNKFYNYWIIWVWLDLLNGVYTSLYGGTPDEKWSPREVLKSGINLEYQTDLSLFILDEYNNKIVEFTYYNAFPTVLSPLNLDYQTTTPINAACSFVFNRLSMDLVSQNP